MTQEKEAKMVHLMVLKPQKLPQAGWKKQDYLPKVNYWKQKLKTVVFRGLLGFSPEVLGLREDFWSHRAVEPGPLP